MKLVAIRDTNFVSKLFATLIFAMFFIFCFFGTKSFATVADNLSFTDTEKIYYDDLKPRIGSCLLVGCITQGNNTYFIYTSSAIYSSQLTEDVLNNSYVYYNSKDKAFYFHLYNFSSDIACYTKRLCKWHL